MFIQHRNAGTITSVVLACIISVASCGQSGTSSANGANQGASSQAAVVQPVHGPAVDKIIIEPRTDQSQAIAEVVAGAADLVLNPMPPAAFQSISPADLDKLQLYTMPAESWSILINPIPDAAPYTWTTVSGQTSFNPLAIREVRFALNWLFDRQHLVDEVLGGHGVAGFTPLPPGLASTARYDAVPAGLGMRPAGDVDRAIGEMNDAMESAARLTENSGRLLKAADGFWQYDGKPVSIKFMLRADEPVGRLPAGRYLASQLEKAGIRVQLLERDRSALATAYYSNPADLAFHLYLEAWAPRTGTPSWELTIGQQYAPRYGFLPGGADPGWWQYRNPTLDGLAHSTADSLELLETGLKEAVRIYLAFQNDSFIANKGRFSYPLVPDPVAGISGLSLRTAGIKAGADAQVLTQTEAGEEAHGDESRILRVLHIRDTKDKDLVPGSWNPASPDGFTDRYSSWIAELISDTGSSAPAGTPETPSRWHNGIETGMADATYSAAHEAGWSTKVSLPWDLYEVLDQLAWEDPEGNVESGLSLVSLRTVDLVLPKYRELLEQQWVPPELDGLVDPEQAARRYQASMNFIESHRHALISNGPFVLSSLDSSTGTAILEAFQEYPYGSDYPIQSAKD
jgi:peptide/nickel transport system substrate-binding protein